MKALKLALAGLASLAVWPVVAALAGHAVQMYRAALVGVGFSPVTADCLAVTGGILAASAGLSLFALAAVGRLMSPHPQKK